MRLIDADALKKDIVAYKTMPEIRKAICDVIDNAPTVEAKTTYDVNSAYDRGFITAMKAYSRPQVENNAELFKQTFGIYATELWSMSERNFLEWLNKEVRNDDKRGY